MSEIVNLYVWHNDWSLTKLLRKIRRTSNSRIRILGAEEYAIMGHSDPTNKLVLSKIKKAIQNTTNTIEFVSGGFPTSKSFYPSENVTYWKTFWPAYTYNELHSRGHKATNTSFTKAFVNFNNRPWDFRCKMMDELARRNLISKGAISWNECNIDYDFKHWKQERLIIDKQYAESTNSYKSFPSIFFESFMSLVNESTMDTVFPTEKTYTPIYFKKPFLVWSVPNFHKSLQELGFELYDEIFDYSFDSIENSNQRLNALLDQVEKIIDIDYQTAYDLVANKAERNYNKMMNIRFNISLVPNSILQFGGYEDLVKDMI